VPRLKAFKWDAWAGERYARWQADKPDVVAVDTETSGTAYYDEPFCATLSWRGRDGSMQSAYIDLEADGSERRRELLRQILGRTKTWVFHNAKFDLQKLGLIDALPAFWPLDTQIEDTQAIFHLLNENEKKALKHLAVVVLKHDDTIMVPYKSGKKKGQLHPVAREKHALDNARRKLGLKVEDGYYYLPREVLVPYAIRDTEFTLELFEKGKPRLEERGAELLALYAQEIELIDVFLRIEGNGLALDLPYLEEATSRWGSRVMELTVRLQELTKQAEFNPNAPAQVKAALEAVGAHVEDTREATLKKIVERAGKGAERAQTVLDYREAAKIHGTYFTNLLAEQRDGVVHPHFNIVGPRTGRMSSGAAANN